MMKVSVIHECYKMCYSVTYLKMNNLRRFVLIATLTKIGCLQSEYPCYFSIEIQSEV